MSLFDDSRRFLFEWYGVGFPDSLFWMAKFFEGFGADELSEQFDAVGIYPAGVMQLLQMGETVVRWQNPRLPMALHGRQYRDVPEFFTVFRGDHDGLHWGLLLDDPAEGFRGVASYYGRGGENMKVYRGIFDAVFERMESAIETDRLEAAISTDGGEFYRWRLGIGESFRDRLRQFVDEHKIPLDDERPLGLPGDTGLSLVVPSELTAGANGELMADCFESDAIFVEAVRMALAECHQGDPVNAMALGRSAWYRGGAAHSEAAFTLLKSAYDCLGRRDLIRILQTHYEYRESRFDDLLTQ
jgi:hypothetical protein